MKTRGFVPSLVTSKENKRKTVMALIGDLAEKVGLAKLPYIFRLRKNHI